MPVRADACVKSDQRWILRSGWTFGCPLVADSATGRVQWRRVGRRGFIGFVGWVGDIRGRRLVVRRRRGRHLGARCSGSARSRGVGGQLRSVYRAGPSRRGARRRDHSRHRFESDGTPGAPGLDRDRDPANVGAGSRDRAHAHAWGVGASAGGPGGAVDRSGSSYASKLVRRIPNATQSHEIARQPNAMKSATKVSDVPLAIVRQVPGFVRGSVAEIPFRTLAIPTFNEQSAAKIVASDSGRIKASRVSVGRHAYKAEYARVASATTIPRRPKMLVSLHIPATSSSIWDKTRRTACRDGCHVSTTGAL